MKRILKEVLNPKTLLIALIALALPIAAGASSDEDGKRFEVSLKDKASLQSGAKLFVNYCLSCHSAAFMRFNRMAEDLEIPPELVEKNMMFAAEKIGEPMKTTMLKDDAERWLGVPPPDLSLVGRLRDPEWLYKFLRYFYIDESSPTGWNNLMFEKVAMPNVLYELQGSRRAIFKTEPGKNGVEYEVLDRFELVKPGKMTTEEYDSAVRDLTNFLVYMGEPAKLVRIKYGIWVMLFLAIFAVFAYMLKKEYWRDVH